MADSTTPFLDLILVEVGASRDTWGAKINTNMSAIDAFLATATPLGLICDFGGVDAPDGWLICDGRLISRTTYSDLFGAIHTIWGAGDGSTTFALPPTPGRALVAPGSTTDDNGTTVTYAFGQKSGATSVGIARANLPNYLLPVSADGAHGHVGSVTDAQGNHAHGGAVTPAGNHHHTVYGAYMDSGAWVAGASGTQVANTNLITSDAPDHAHAIAADGTHAHNVNIPTGGGHTHSISLGGSGTLLRLVNPTLAVTKIIFAGAQASTGLAAGMSAPVLRRAIASPLRGGVARAAR
jgi:microcystin-dependent protein